MGPSSSAAGSSDLYDSRSTDIKIDVASLFHSHHPDSQNGRTPSPSDQHSNWDNSELNSTSGEPPYTWNSSSSTTDYANTAGKIAGKNLLGLLKTGGAAAQAQQNHEPHYADQHYHHQQQHQYQGYHCGSDYYGMPRNYHYNAHHGTQSDANWWYGY